MEALRSARLIRTIRGKCGRSGGRVSGRRFVSFILKRGFTRGKQEFSGKTHKI